MYSLVDIFDFLLDDPSYLCLLSLLGCLVSIWCFYFSYLCLSIVARIRFPRIPREVNWHLSVLFYVSIFSVLFQEYIITVWRSGVYSVILASQLASIPFLLRISQISEQLPYKTRLVLSTAVIFEAAVVLSHIPSSYYISLSTILFALVHIIPCSVAALHPILPRRYIKPRKRLGLRSARRCTYQSVKCYAKHRSRRYQA